MDLRKLKTLIDLVSESNISELEIAEADGKVRIVKAGGGGQVALTAYAPTPAVAPPLAAPATSPEPVAAPMAPSGKVVTSPMVGTFYRSASPGGEPMVKVGSTVTETQAVCIIEAMKIMNEIEAGFSGSVREVLVENGQAVEFGQPLFVID